MVWRTARSRKRIRAPAITEWGFRSRASDVPGLPRHVSWWVGGEGYQAQATVRAMTHRSPSTATSPKTA